MCSTILILIWFYMHWFNFSHIAGGHNRFDEFANTNCISFNCWIELFYFLSQSFCHWNLEKKARPFSSTNFNLIEFIVTYDQLWSIIVYHGRQTNSKGVFSYVLLHVCVEDLIDKWNVDSESKTPILCEINAVHYETSPLRLRINLLNVSFST